MKKKFDKKILIIIIGIVVIVFFVFMNYDNTFFFDATAIELIMLLVGILLTFFYVERRNDKERKNIAIEHLIDSIEGIVDNPKFCTLDENRTALMLHKSCGNKIKYLKDASIKEFKDDIDFISNEFDEIRALYSEHMENENELKMLENDFKRHVQNIRDKCDKIRINLYT